MYIEELIAKTDTIIHTLIPMEQRQQQSQDHANYCFVVHILKAIICLKYFHQPHVAMNMTFFEVLTAQSVNGYKVLHIKNQRVQYLSPACLPLSNETYQWFMLYVKNLRGNHPEDTINSGKDSAMLRQFIKGDQYQNILKEIAKPIEELNVSHVPVNKVRGLAKEMTDRSELGQKDKSLVNNYIYHTIDVHVGYKSGRMTIDETVAASLLMKKNAVISLICSNMPLFGQQLQ